MNIDTQTFPSRQIWLVAVIVAALVGIPLSVFADKTPWLIVIPILIGVTVILAQEIWASLSRNAQLTLVGMPKEYLELARYRGHVALSIPVAEDDTRQEFFEFIKTSRRKVTKSAEVITDDAGNKVHVIDSERFVTLLFNRILPSTDQVAELSLLRALRRYERMHTLSPQLEQFLKDKTVLTVIKADFKGNTAQAINRAGEAVIRELVRQASASKQNQLKAEAS